MSLCTELGVQSAARGLWGLRATGGGAGDCILLSRGR